MADERASYLPIVSYTRFFSDGSVANPSSIAGMFTAEVFIVANAMLGKSQRAENVRREKEEYNRKSRRIAGQ